MSNVIDLTGKRFSKLLVLGMDSKKEVISANGKKHTIYYWKCQCDCGNQVVRNGCHLRKGATKSCGCNKGYGAMHKYNKDNMFKEGTNLAMIKNIMHNGNELRGIKHNENSNKFQAIIVFKGITHKLGNFDTLEEAKRARRKAEDKYYKPILEKYNYL